MYQWFYNTVSSMLCHCSVVWFGPAFCIRSAGHMNTADNSNRARSPDSRLRLMCRDRCNTDVVVSHVIALLAISSRYGIRVDAVMASVALHEDAVPHVIALLVTWSSTLDLLLMHARHRQRGASCDSLPSRSEVSRYTRQWYLRHQ